MINATITLTVQVEYDPNEQAIQDVTDNLAGRCTAFLYPAGLTVQSCEARRQSPGEALSGDDLADLREALALRISHSKETLERAELSGALDGRPASLVQARLQHIGRLEALQARLALR